ncbi:TetR/AcrR family transcriptional regulator [Streptacidiphilus sp. 4-A2]|nr:TetR/AcrR family transcriptional regulator [Streptacidiphilus sp. 4-A2]
MKAAGDGTEAGTRPGRPRSEARRAAILAAAGDLMIEGGLKAATMEAIAARAGVGKATVYKWWPSRGALALEGFMLRAADSWSLPESATASEALHILVLASVQLFRDTSAGPLMRALVADAQSDPEIAQALREQWLGPRRAVAAEIIRNGVLHGEFREDLDLATTLDLLFAPSTTDCSSPTPLGRDLRRAPHPAGPRRDRDDGEYPEVRYAKTERSVQ